MSLAVTVLCNLSASPASTLTLEQTGYARQEAYLGILAAHRLAYHSVRRKALNTLRLRLIGARSTHECQPAKNAIFHSLRRLRLCWSLLSHVHEICDVNKCKPVLCQPPSSSSNTGKARNVERVLVWRGHGSNP